MPFGLLHLHLGPWLSTHFEAVPDEQLPPIEDRAELWTALGLEPDLVDLLANRLRLQWDLNAGKLQVAASCVAKGYLLANLSQALLCIWELNKFSTS